jgi:nitrogen regulatory protein PII
MSDSARTAKVKLVTVIVPTERLDSFSHDLTKLGITGYTSIKADGHGHHGPRHDGLLDDANIRFEMLVAPSVAQALLQLVEKTYGDDAVVAFAMNVDVVPYKNFA